MKSSELANWTNRQTASLEKRKKCVRKLSENYGEHSEESMLVSYS